MSRTSKSSINILKLTTLSKVVSFNFSIKIKISDEYNNKLNFNDILKSQLVLKGVITIEDWISIKEHIQYTFLKDGYFAELKNAEILRERINLANEITPYVGKYYSVEFVRKNIL
jgi:hypothetical protein